MSLAGSASAGTGQITRHFVRYFGANLPFGGNLERISNHRKNGCVGDFEIPATRLICGKLSKPSLILAKAVRFPKAKSAFFSLGKSIISLL